MRLVSFSQQGSPRVGVFDADTDSIVDLAQAAPDLPRTMNDFIAAGGAALQAAQAAADAGGHRLARADVELLAPIPAPIRNIMCVGRNYYEHAREFHDSGFDATAGASAVPDHPIIFTKATTSVIGPGAAIPAHLDPTHSVDYEGELTVVIGQGGRGISKARAFDHVYGYTIINDVTARTLQHRHKQWFLGKSLDGFCPMGPLLLTADEAGDVRDFRLTTTVNGEVRQDVSAADLIFDIPTLIETISACITLLPGDLIATGTPVGCGIGFDPPLFLKKGDVVAVTITPIGTLENPVG